MECRGRIGLIQETVFRLWTCSMCYSYLFRDSGEFRSEGYRLVYNNLSSSHGKSYFVADIDNASTVSAVCQSLRSNNEDCQRWVSCCRAAIACCKNQQLSKTTLEDGYCPETWDGYSCVEATHPATRISLECPSYISRHRVGSEVAFKDCTANGTWWKNPQTNQEWTNYSMCLRTEEYRYAANAAISCSALSLVFLIPACAVFLTFPSLREQNRIRIHLCLFTSLILTAMVSILWNVLVYNDRLDKPTELTFLYTNTAACTFLCIMLRYSRVANYFWMFFEGFHLHRLMAQAFKVPKSILPYYITGWGLPTVPVIIYSIIRGVRQDNRCWVTDANILEWIIYTPSLFCIAANLFFMCRIIFLIVKQLQPHPNEPSNFRRALKATLFLVPLFGIHSFVVIYRPPLDVPATRSYEVFAKVIKDSQGAVVSLIYCFLNVEVHTQIQHTWRRLKYEASLKAEQRTSISMASAEISRVGSKKCKSASSR